MGSARDQERATRMLGEKRHSFLLLREERGGKGTKAEERLQTAILRGTGNGASFGCKALPKGQKCIHRRGKGKEDIMARSAPKSILWGGGKIETLQGERSL